MRQSADKGEKMHALGRWLAIEGRPLMIKDR